MKNFRTIKNNKSYGVRLFSKIPQKPKRLKSGFKHIANCLKPGFKHSLWFH